MKLIVISSEHFIEQEADIINELFCERLEYFHLRKPDLTSDNIRLLLDKIKPKFHHLIALHQFHNIAKDYGINRLHFTEERRREANESQLMALKNRGTLLSTSVHSNDAISSLSSAFNYTFFSPVFNSISKPGYKGILEDKNRPLNAHTSKYLIALGGINKQNISTINTKIFHGAALLGALWKQPKMAVQEFRDVKSLIDKIYSTYPAPF